MFLASPPIDFETHDTYFIVGHFHSVVMTLVLAGMAGLYYWCPKMKRIKLRLRTASLGSPPPRRQGPLPLIGNALPKYPRVSDESSPRMI